MNKSLLFRDTSVILLGYENHNFRALPGAAKITFRGRAMHVALISADTILRLERRWFKTAE